MGDQRHSAGQPQGDARRLALMFWLWQWVWGVLPAEKGRGAMEEGVQDCHLQCMNKQLWTGQPDWANLPAEMGIALDRHRTVPICTDAAGMEGWTGAAGRVGEHTVGRTG